MAKNTHRRGATRKPVRKERQPMSWGKPGIAWGPLLQNTFIIMFVFVTALSVVWLQKEDTLPILHVTVDGELTHVDKASLVAAVKPYVTGSFINIDVAKLREAGESAPWVKQIQVKRSWPDTIHLVVEEQQAIAKWGQAGLVNSDGDLFYPPKSSFPKELTLLKGPESTNTLMVKRYAEIVEMFGPIGLELSSITMDNRRSWSLYIKGGMTVKLGRADSENRLKRFVALYTTQFSEYQDQINIVDMRYTNGLAINWKSGKQPEFNGTV